MKTALTGILFFVLLHPVHVSVTGIEFDPGKNIFNLFVKVYSDDMERDMKIGNKMTGESFAGNEEGYQRWLSDRISIIVDGRPLVLKLKKVEIDGLEHKFTLEAKSKRKAGIVSVLNTINTRLYQDQSNMLMFKYNDVEEGCKLTSSDTIKVFNVQ
jgi:hypothetical protein